MTDPTAVSSRVPRRLLVVLAAAVAVGTLVWWGRAGTAPRTELRWGGDASGGEPYLIERAGQEPGGFEGEVAAYLGERLGLTPRFVQRTWAELPQNLLLRRDVDVILNGYEWFPAREESMASTVPYFAYRLRLVVRNDSRIRDWSNLRRQPGGLKLRVGVLKDSAAQRYLEEQYADDVAVEAYDEEGVTGVMLKVAARALDATVQDAPAVTWYLRQPVFEALHAVGPAVKPTTHNYYVMYVRPEDDDLRQKLNDAIRAGLQDGTFRRIYEKYGLWDDEQAGLVDVGRNWPPEAISRRPPLAWFAGQLTFYALTTIKLAVISFPLAVTLGLLIALGRLYGPRWLAVPLAAYVEVIRGTPLLLQLAVIFYFLGLAPDWAGILGLAINYAAYEAEIYRAGLLAIPRGQMEAALSLGMARPTAVWRIVVPQAVRLVVPPVTNDFIALFKDTSVCSAIAVVELTSRYRTLAVNNPGLVVQLGAMTAVLYLVMSYPLSLLARRLEREQQAVHG
ncbi:MAG: ABC transporter permease subunit [Gemmataceae bacterium]